MVVAQPHCLKPHCLYNFVSKVRPGCKAVNHVCNTYHRNSLEAYNTLEAKYAGGMIRWRHDTLEA